MSDWVLGQTSSKHETSGRGPGTISSGVGDHGGVSYGSYQFSTNKGVVQEFLQYKPAIAAEFKGLMPGTEGFNDKWRSLAKADPEGFHGAQHEFIQHKFYDVQMRRLQDSGIDLSQRGPAVQDMLWSTSVQYRGLTKGIVTGALAGKELAALSDADIVSAVQDYKRDHNSSLFASSPSYWPGLLKRAANEKQDLLELARSYGGDKPPTQKVSLSPEQERTLQQFKDQAGPRLAAQGLSAEQIDTVGQAALRHLQEHPGTVEPRDFLVSKDGSTVAVRHDSGQVSEFNVAEALRGTAGRAEHHPNPAGIRDEVLLAATSSPDAAAPAMSR
jgi:hypothetical protein